MSEDDLRAQIASLQAQVATLDRHVGRIDGKVDTLVTAEAERQGREKAVQKDDAYRHDDRWQVWLRAFLPAAVLTAIFNFLIQVFSGGGEP